MKLLNSLLKSPKVFSFRKELLSYNSTLNFGMIIYFNLYFFWITTVVRVVLGKWFEIPNENRPPIAIPINIVLILTSLLFFIFHKKYNNKAIKDRRTAEAIGRFFLYLSIFVIIRALIVTYLCGEELYIFVNKSKYIELMSHPKFKSIYGIKTLHEVFVIDKSSLGNGMMQLRMFVTSTVLVFILTIPHFILLVLIGILYKKNNSRIDDTKTAVRNNNNWQSKTLLIFLFLSSQYYLGEEVFKLKPNNLPIILPLLFSLISSIFLFYSVYFSSLKILREKHYIVGFFWTFLLVEVVTFFQSNLFSILYYNNLSRIDVIDNEFLIRPIIKKVNFFITIISFTVGYAKRTEELFEEKIKAVIRQKDLEIEANNLEIEAKKSQIDAHFIYNGLNFIRSKSLPLSKELSDSVVLFAAIMRYSLEGATREESPENLLESTVRLEEELEHLRNYIAFNQLRFSNELQIKYEQDGNGRRLRILPLILINYVENAMKYGVLDDAQYPVIVRVKIEQNQLILYVHNKKSHDKGVVSTQKGNDITQRRLELAYPDAHNLKIVDEPEFYTMSLTIQL